MKKVLAVTCAVLLGLTFAGSAPAVAQALPPSVGPAGYTFCANENSNCSFSDLKSVAYGANGVFNYLNLTGGTACTNAVFDDPLFGTVKACYIKSIGATTPAPPSTYSLSVPASSVNAGANVTVTWSAPSGSQSKDWVGLFKSGDSNNNYIGGKWIQSESGEVFENINPANTEDVIGRFPLSTSDDVNAAVNAAQQAFDGWRSTPARSAYAMPGTTSVRRSSAALACGRSVTGGRRLSPTRLATW